MEKHGNVGNGVPGSRRPVENRPGTSDISDKRAINLVGSHSFRPTILPGHMEAAIIGFDRDNDDSGEGLAPPRPRRLWKINDTGLRQRPPFYPRCDERCCRRIDASITPPSVVAIRIAECLRRRNIATEFDDEAATATAMTADRCHFTVFLYMQTIVQQQNRQHNFVVVECVKQRGCTLTFHNTAKAVLDAAMSMDIEDGSVRRNVYRSSPLEYPRLVSDDGAGGLVQLPTKPASVVSRAATHALEQVAVLLKKDRVDTQKLGMERLISLTDQHSSGVDTAMYAALAVLGAPLPSSASGSSNQHQLLLKEIHQKWILSLIIDRILPGEETTEDQSPEASFSFSCATSLLGTGGGGPIGGGGATAGGDVSTAYPTISYGGGRATDGGDALHGSTMRSGALRSLANALTLLNDVQPKILASILHVQSPQLVSTSFLSALVEDIKGAARPPAVVVGTRLASPHEAILAMRCLRFLGVHHDQAKRFLVQEKTLELFEKARAVGQSTNCLLAQEAKDSFNALTEDVRSC